MIGHRQLLRQRLEAGGDLGDLLHAVALAPRRSGEQLQVVDDQHAEALLALQLAGARGQLGDGDAAGLIDVERAFAHHAADLDELTELVLVDHAAADLLRADLRLLGKNARGQLLGRHFEREEADDGAVGRLHRAVRLLLGAVRLGDVVGDVGGQRRLTHRGASGENDEIGRLQAAELVVEIGKTGRQTRQMPVALVGGARHLDGSGQRRAEAEEARPVLALLGQLVEPPFRFLDLLLRCRIDGGVVGAVDHVLADDDQRAARGEVIDGATVVLGVDDGRRAGRRACRDTAAPIASARSARPSRRTCAA